MSKYENGIETQNRILKACKKLFYEKGYNETTFLDICREANVNQSAISYHFDKKENIFFKLYEELGNRMEEVVREYIPKDSGKELEAHFLGYYIIYHELVSDEKLRRFHNLELTQKYYLNDTEKKIRQIYMDKFDFFSQTGNSMDELNYRVYYNAEVGLLQYLYEHIDSFTDDGGYIRLAEYDIRLFCDIFNCKDLADDRISAIREIAQSISWEKISLY